VRSAVAAAAVALVAAACAAAGTTTTTARTATTVAAPTTTIAPVAAPATVAASSTTTAATIGIIGDEAFTEQTDAALSLLASEAGDGYAQVLRYIDTIESVTAGSGMDVFTRTFLVGDETAFAPGFAREDQVVWLAGTIVHDSCHSRLYAEGVEYAGRDAELACMRDQLDTLEEIDHDYFEDYVQGLIDGVDDPENAYWTDPDRHW
jgi:hypothetical protein